MLSLLQYVVLAEVGEDVWLQGTEKGVSVAFSGTCEFLCDLIPNLTSGGFLQIICSMQSEILC